MPLQFDDLGFRTNVDVLKSFIDIKGMNVIDAGCGGMTFTRHLSELGGNVLAIDPDPVQAELNRNGDRWSVSSSSKQVLTICPPMMIRSTAFFLATRCTTFLLSFTRVFFQK